jgi:hypothetical protein
MSDGASGISQTENEESFFDVSDDALERLADGMSTCTNHGGCVSDVRLPFMYVPFPLPTRTACL